MRRELYLAFLAVLAGRVRRLMSGRTRWRNRITGGLMIGAGLGLAMARRS
jgi:homoserine/homoserine lactone efflux protein